MKKIKKIIFVFAIAMLAAGCAKSSQGKAGFLLPEGSMDSQEDASHHPEGPGTENGKGSGEISQPVSTIYVQVSGAVKRPGVYELPEGSRVFEAVELAGGLTPKADQKSLNQAEALTDGQMIWILTTEEAKEGSKSQTGNQKEDGRINLNSASKEELMSLPGIGEAKAEAILAWREAHGGFAKSEDLMEIEGIKEGVFSKIEDYVRVQ